MPRLQIRAGFILVPISAGALMTLDLRVLYIGLGRQLGSAPSKPVEPKQLPAARPIRSYDRQHGEASSSRLTAMWPILASCRPV